MPQVIEQSLFLFFTQIYVHVRPLRYLVHADHLRRERDLPPSPGRRHRERRVSVLVGQEEGEGLLVGGGGRDGGGDGRDDAGVIRKVSVQ